MAFHFIPSLLLTLSLLSIAIHAQGKVGTVSSAAYARVGSKLYAVGGQIGTASLGQTIVLDFSTSWDAASPAWKRLQNGPDQSDFTGALSANGSTFITLRSGGSSYARLYDVPTDGWSASKITLPDVNRPGLTIVTDPTSNRAYIPFGSQMYIYDFSSDTTKNISMATSPIATWMYFQGAWWSARKSILFFGGYCYATRPEAYTTGLYMYTPETNVWSSSPLPTQGDAPSPRADMCVVISDDGSTLIVFGGRTDPSNVRPTSETEVISSDIFVLDLVTLTWTRAPDSGRPRMYSVCTLYNGIFFSWGGEDGTKQVVLDSSAILYDVKKKTYLTRNQGPVSSSSGLSTGGIIGIAAGVVAVIVLAALIAWSVRRRKRIDPFSKPPAYGPSGQAPESDYKSPAGKVTSSGDGYPPPVTTELSPEYYSGYQQVPRMEFQQSPHQQAYSQYPQQLYHQASAPPTQSYPPPPASPTSSTQYQSYAQQQGYHDSPASYNSKATVPRGPEAITVFDGPKTAASRGPEAIPVVETFQASQNPHS
ncbi:MAG: hypothetical protein J3Q66DRAFT_133799 [Benniella sp.]|nr:MAG: hypothetical protein J3Q66DRAFT_133799 [Benniella sp.]